MARDAAITIGPLDRLRDTETEPRLDALTDQAAEPTHEQISRLAYQLWKEGGCRSDSALADWFDAEHYLRTNGE